MDGRSDKYFVAAYKGMYEELKAKGFKPTTNVTDKDCSEVVQDYINSQNESWPLVEPNNEQVNAVEQAIQTFKNDFIPGLSSVNTDFPLQL